MSSSGFQEKVFVSQLWFYFIFRAMIELKGFYSLEKPGDFHNLVDVQVIYCFVTSVLTNDCLQYMSAMIHPGGGRNDVPQRFKRHFITFNCTIPTDDAIDHIFGTIAQVINQNQPLSLSLEGPLQRQPRVLRRRGQLDAAAGADDQEDVEDHQGEDVAHPLQVPLCLQPEGPLQDLARHDRGHITGLHEYFE